MRNRNIFEFHQTRRDVCAGSNQASKFLLKLIKAIYSFVSLNATAVTCVPCTYKIAHVYFVPRRSDDIPYRIVSHTNCIFYY